MARKNKEEDLKDYEGRSTEDINDDMGFLEGDENFQDSDMTGTEGGESVGQQGKGRQSGQRTGQDQNQADEGMEDDDLL